MELNTESTPKPPPPPISRKCLRCENTSNFFSTPWHSSRRVASFCHTTFPLKRSTSATFPASFARAELPVCAFSGAFRWIWGWTRVYGGSAPQFPPKWIVGLIMRGVNAGINPRTGSTLRDDHAPFVYVSVSSNCVIETEMVADLFFLSPRAPL